MPNNLRNFINSFMPFISLGIAIVIIYFLFIFILYIAVIGAIIGGIIYLGLYIKNKFFSKTNNEKINSSFFYYKKSENHIKHQGRVFENEE